MRARLLTWLSLTLSLSACAGSTATECKVGADCASGLCNVDGTCGESPSSSSTGTGGGASSSAGGGSSVGGGSATGTGGSTAEGSGGSGACSPNHDGQITREEVPLAAGLHATFRVASSAPVDTAGDSQGDGSRVWDLTGDLSGDHAVIVETLSMTGQWFEADYPGATYASRLSDSSDLLGVFNITGSALLLLGIVSPEDGLTKTELIYDPPVTVLSFPLSEGSTFSTSTTATGFFEGAFPTFILEEYTSTADAHGTMKTPYADFDVLRVGVDLTRTWGIVSTKRTYLFISECFGTVASIVSKDNELSKEFTTASEVKRLAP